MDADEVLYGVCFFHQCHVFFSLFAFFGLGPCMEKGVWRFGEGGGGLSHLGEVLLFCELCRLPISRVRSVGDFCLYDYIKDMKA